MSFASPGLRPGLPNEGRLLAPPAEWCCRLQQRGGILSAERINRMKRVLLGMLLVMAVCPWASAESSVWKAQKDNAVIYLGGTFHMLRAADYPLPPEFDRAYQASEIVVFETDIGTLQEPATQQLLLAKAVYADGSTIDRHLSARAYGELKAYCDANAVPLQAYSRLKPSMLLTALMLLELEKLGVSRQGVDQFFYEAAHKDRKVVQGLETVEEQIDYLLSMADGTEDEFVSYSLMEMRTIRQDFESLANAWRTGDAGKLAELLLVKLKTRQPKLYRKLVTDRNRNWLPLIDAYQKTPRTEFILVGAAHLVGPDGIIETLKKKGYKVDKL